jgi:hypothetical protein
VLAFVGGCMERGFKPPTLAEVREELAPKHESWGVRFTVSETALGREESRPRMHIVSDYMATFETADSTYTLMRGEPDSTGNRVLAFLFDVDGDTSATVTTDRMLYFESERRFEARGQVVVVTPEDKRLETEHLHWNEVDRKIRTPGFARITTPGERVQGYELVADEDLATYTLARVTGQVTVDDD